MTTFEPPDDRVAMAIEASKMPSQEREDLVEEIFRRFAPVGEDSDNDNVSHASSGDSVTY